MNKIKDTLQYLKFLCLIIGNCCKETRWFEKSGKVWRREVVFSQHLSFSGFRRITGTASAFVLCEGVPYLGY